MTNSGQVLYNKAKNLILGGNSLLSKRPEMFLPNFWPSYFKKTKDVFVWDIDNNKYTDVSIMGIGTNILGYSNKYVDDAVLKTVKNGNMSTLNCPEEVLLAEKILDLHQWGGMVKFARTGGEANKIALRIARCNTAKNNIAFCGYHGWHDWYLSVNINNQDGLKNHLIEGLSIKGIDTNLKNSVFSFNYNKIDELENLLSNHSIGTIIMEVKRNYEPTNDFLKNVRKLADKYGCILIFDECTSGFRETFGGLHLKYDVNPDIAMFGKALGNGYAINAIVGKKEIMLGAQDSFISSTFWTERIGPTAALATLEIMEKEKSWEKISEIGFNIKSKWNEISKNNNVEISISGLDSLASFTFNEDHLINKTYLTKKMLESGYLASNLFYVSTKHNENILNMYYEKLNETFYNISKLDNEEKMKYLDNNICHSGFKRVN